MALGDGVERPRIAGALISEGFVVEVDSVPEGLARLADESFDLAILDLPWRPARDAAGGARARGVARDAAVHGSGPDRRRPPDARRPGLAREVAAVLPEPLPEVDALLRAHVKRLAGFRRARTRGLLVINAYAGIKDELALAAAEPRRPWTAW